MVDNTFGFRPTSGSGDGEDDDARGADRDASSRKPSGSGDSAGSGHPGHSGGASDSGNGGGTSSPGGNNPFEFLFGGSMPGGMPGGAPGTGAGPGGSMPDFGALFGQFGNMLADMGRQMSQGGQASAVNFDLAERTATQSLGADPTLSSGEREAVVDSVRLAETWLDGATSLPAGAQRSEAWIPREWITQTIPVWKRIVTPIAEGMNEASLQALPEEARQMMGPLMGIMSSVQSTSLGSALGQALSKLAREVVTVSEIGLPLGPEGTAAVLPKAVAPFAEEVDKPQREVMVYLSAREAAYQRLYMHVPWLRQQILSAVEEYAGGVTIDYSHLQNLAEQITPEMMQDPARMQEMLGDTGENALQPRITNTRPQALARLEALLALVDGWVAVVVDDALHDRLPSAAALAESWRRRRVTGSAGEQSLADLVGLELRPRKVREAENLWRRLGEAVGTDRRDDVWAHPDVAPHAEDLDNPARFIDRIIGGDTPSIDDPIAEIERLMAEEAERDAAAATDGDARDNDPSSSETDNGDTPSS